MNAQLLARLVLLEAQHATVEPSLMSGVDCFGTLIVEMLKIKHGGSINDTPSDLRYQTANLIMMCETLNAKY